LAHPALATSGRTALLYTISGETQTNRPIDRLIELV